MPEIAAADSRETASKTESKRRRRRLFPIVGVLATTAVLGLGIGGSSVPAEESSLKAERIIHGPDAPSFIPPITEEMERFLWLQVPEHQWLIIAWKANADGVYDRLAECETHGNWKARGPEYQGALGIYWKAWQQYKLYGMPDNAGDATKIEQIVVGERIRNEASPQGSFRGNKWGCAPKVGAP